jgi:hypothetical protein
MAKDVLTESDPVGKTAHQIRRVHFGRDRDCLRRTDAASA